MDRISVLLPARPDGAGRTLPCVQDPKVTEVVSIHRVAGRGGPATPLEEARLVADFGLVGDWRSRSRRGRQITLIEVEALSAVAAALGIVAVPPGASRRQIVTRGIVLADAIGRCLRVGEVLVRVEERCEPCANMERRIGPGACAALAGRSGVCGRVLEGGVVRPGDPVALAGEPGSGGRLRAPPLTCACARPSCSCPAWPCP